MTTHPDPGAQRRAIDFGDMPEQLRRAVWPELHELLRAIQTPLPVLPAHPHQAISCGCADEESE